MLKEKNCTYFETISRRRSFFFFWGCFTKWGIGCLELVPGSNVSHSVTFKSMFFFLLTLSVSSWLVIDGGFSLSHGRKPTILSTSVLLLSKSLMRVHFCARFVGRMHIYKSNQEPAVRWEHSIQSARLTFKREPNQNTVCLSARLHRQQIILRLILCSSSSALVKLKGTGSDSETPSKALPYCTCWSLAAFVVAV